MSTTIDTSPKTRFVLYNFTGAVIVSIIIMGIIILYFGSPFEQGLNGIKVSLKHLFGSYYLVPVPLVSGIVFAVIFSRLLL